MNTVFYIKKASERLAKPVIQPVLCIGLFLLGNGCCGSSNKLGVGMDDLASAYATSAKLLQQGVETLSGAKEAVVEAVEKERSSYMGQAAGWLGANAGFYTGKYLGAPLVATAALGAAWFLPLPILAKGAIGVGVFHGVGKSYTELTTSGATWGKDAGEYAGLALVAATKAIPRTIYNYGMDQYKYYAAMADCAAYLEKSKYLLII